MCSFLCQHAYVACMEVMYIVQPKVNKAIFMQFGKLVIEIENRLWYTSYCSDDHNNYYYCSKFLNFLLNRAMYAYWIRIPS